MTRTVCIYCDSFSTVNLKYFLNKVRQELVALIKKPFTKNTQMVLSLNIKKGSQRKHILDCWVRYLKLFHVKDL